MTGRLFSPVKKKGFKILHEFEHMKNAVPESYFPKQLSFFKNVTNCEETNINPSTSCHSSPSHVFISSIATPSHVEAAARCHWFNLSEFQPSAYIPNIGHLNAQRPTFSVYVSGCVCEFECLVAPFCSELQTLVAAE